MKPKVITSSEFEVGGEVYHITVRLYDEELKHVTADWFCQPGGTAGELGYGVRSCDEAISLAEKAILNYRKKLRHVQA